MGVLGEDAHFLGDVGEALALLAGAGGLDRGVQRQHVGLGGDVGDRLDDLVDVGGLLAERAHDCGGVQRALAHVLHRLLNLGGALHALFRELLGLGALALGLAGVLGGVAIEPSISATTSLARVISST